MPKPDHRSVREVADMLGLSRQRVHILLQPYRDQLIPAIQGWRVPASVIRAIRQRPIGRGGRPRKRE